jgi:two-component system sensor histidine kinase SenX3
VIVEDQGPGIPARERSRIFEPFYRGGHAAVGNIPGSGLGLAIVRHVAAEHGGKVTVESGPGGQGSVFTIRLPAAAASETVSTPVEAPG